MKKVTKSNCFCAFLFGVLFCVFFQNTLSAHDVGSIKGVVKDSKTGEELIGVNLIIKNTMMGTSTGIDGSFQFVNIHEGEYTLVISYIGYKPKQVDLTVRKDEVTIVDLELEESAYEIDSYAVIAEQPITAASSKSIRKIDIETRPVKSSQDLLKLVPGLITAQHAGGGKAEQIFLRGFDADHGTDVNISVDGIPVNMVTHAHGQGYADLHFLIPEVVDNIGVYKGPYFARFGNLATAGAVEFKTKNILKNNLVKLEGGSFNTGKFTMLYQIGKGSEEQNGYAALQYFTTDGPFENPLDLQRFNVYGKYFVNLSHTSRLSVSLGSFSSTWNASGQIPERAVKQGIITRFGSIDNMEGGNTSRTNLSIKYEQKDEGNNTFVIQAYLCDYSFKLFSDFTFYLEDSVNDDMIEQAENRFLHGLNVSYNSVNQRGRLIFKTSFGAGYRGDDINVELWHSPDRIRLENFSQATVRERDIFTWIDEEIVTSAKFRVQVGLRADLLTFNVDDLAGTALDTAATGLPHASGYASQLTINPKLNLVYSPVPDIDLYVNTGTGFHSNDARNVILSEKAKELAGIFNREGLSEEQIDDKLSSLNFNPEQRNVTTLPRAFGAEIGCRAQLFKNLNVAVSLWYMYLESEFVYVGDGGYSELSKPTRRLGFDFEGRCRITRWLWADMDMTLSDGRITEMPEGQDYIPLAPRVTITGGFSMLDFYGFDATLRITHIGDRPANEDNTVTAYGYSVMNFGLAYHLRKFTFSATIENLTNTDWNEAQFDTESRLKWETEPVSEIHFTPGDPLNVQFGISMKF